MKFIQDIDIRIRGALSVCLFLAGLTVFIAALYADNVISFESLRTLHVNNVPQNLEIVKNSIPRLFTVYSGSMEPTIKTASVIVTLPSKTYDQGDIITFRPTDDEEYIVTHRIAFKQYASGLSSAPFYVTTGDANDIIDPWQISDSQVLGKVVFWLPYAGHLTDFARTPRGFILLVIVPATIVIYEELKTLGRESLKFIQRRRKAYNDKPSNDRKDLQEALISEGRVFPKVSILLPVLGAGLLLISASISFLSDLEISTSNGVSAATSFGPLAINEFLPDPNSEFQDEWVEIYNTSDQPVDLTGWTLEDESLPPRDLTPLGSVSAMSHVVFVDPGDNWINNSGDTITLKDASAKIIDRHTYNASDPDKTIGRENDGSEVFKECDTPTQGITNNGSC